MTIKNFHYLLVSLLLSLCLSTMSAAAADLAQVKSAGLVGERLDGFLGLVRPDAGDDIKALVKSINAQRLAEYQRIAAKNGISVDEVARLTAEKVIGQAVTGQFVETPSGWQQR